MVSSNHLKPGEKGSIAVKVDTSNRTGSLTKAVDVMSNDPVQPKVRLIVRAALK